MGITLIVLVTFVAGLVSCQKETLNDCEIAATTRSNTPNSDSSELAQFNSDTNIVDFNIARKIAILDMAVNGTFDKHGWQDCTLEIMPVTLFGFDDKPLFYDFMVVDKSSNAHGTVTVHARKRSAMQIKQISLNPVNYTDGKKSFRNNRIYADVYANRYISNDTKSTTGRRTVINMATHATQYDAQFLEDEQRLAKLRTEILPKVLEDFTLANQVADTLEAQMVAEHEATRQFWAYFEQNDINASTDADLRMARLSGLGGDNDSPMPPIKDFPEGDTPPLPPSAHTFTVKLNSDCKLAWIDEYQNWFRNYEYGGYCGPWITGYIFSTQYNTYIDYNQFDREGYTVQGGELRGAMTAPCLNNALRDYSSSRGDNITVNLAGMTKDDAYWRIRRGNSVVRLMILWNGVPFFGDTGYHWTHLYGSYKIQRALSTSYYFLQADNGSAIEYRNGYRVSRDPRNAQSYTLVEALDTLFGIND